MEKSFAQFILPLIVIGVGLLIAEYFVQRFRYVLGGLGVNVLAAAGVLLYQRYYNPDWNILPFFIGAVLAATLILPIAFLRFRLIIAQSKQHLIRAEQIQLDLASCQDQLRLALESHNESKSAPPPLSPSGITLYARNYSEATSSHTSLRFHDVTGQDFGDYARRFVLDSPAGSTFKILGIDWTELFGAAVSGTSERYVSRLGDPRTVFKVILLDPTQSIGLEKRTSEYDLVIDGKPRYERNFPFRVYGKILGSTEMLSDYHKHRPKQVLYKFISEIPAVCCVMNGERILFHPYTRCHKGWDSPIFIADKKPGGIYEFYEEYFEFLWSNPRLKISPSQWQKAKGQLSPEFARFRELLATSCSGPAHVDCDKIF
jgi:hypothetical protein